MRKKKTNEEALFDMDNEESTESTHMDKIMTILEDAGIEYSSKKTPSGKSLLLDNFVVFSFGREGELEDVNTSKL